MKRTVYTKFRANFNYSEKIVDEETEVSKRLFDAATSECSHQWHYVALKHFSSRNAFSTASAKGSGGIRSFWLNMVLRTSNVAEDFCSIENVDEAWRDIVLAYDNDEAAAALILDSWLEEYDRNFKDFWAVNSQAILALKP